MPKPAQLLLQHQRLSDRERVLRDNIERIESALASDPEVVQLEEKVEAAQAAQQAVAARLHESDRAREDHRSRLRSREKELMSGRIRNPTELMQMSEEVKHMKARFVEEEDAELQLMEDVEIADDTMSAVMMPRLIQSHSTRVPPAASVRYSLKRLTMSDTFWPPKPKLLLRT